MPDTSETLQTSGGNLPPVLSDSAFWGMTATQFLGAFNDNLFKQIVLLLCVDYTLAHASGGDIFQTLAQALFAIPFVLFSGLAGFLSDRTEKRQIVILMKVAEIVVMLAGVVAFAAAKPGSLELIGILFFVLCLMGAQSAFFGPSKYGILPEMLRSLDLPVANGIIQMTTFLAIILGTASAGFCKHAVGDRLWIVSSICVLVAVLGTATSLLLRKTPAARPGMQFELSALGISRETRQLLADDRPLLAVLFVASIFWLVGGVVLTTVNAFGKIELGYADHVTSLLASCMGLGIAVGCLLAGKLSSDRSDTHLVRIGAWGISIALALAGGLGFVPVSPESLAWPLGMVLTALGCAAGLFVVPLQVYLQVQPPDSQKGRVIAAMNLMNWIGILMAAVVYFACSSIFGSAHISRTFLVLSACMLPIAAVYRPPSSKFN